MWARLNPSVLKGSRGWDTAHSLPSCLRDTPSHCPGGWKLGCRSPAGLGAGEGLSWGADGCPFPPHLVERGEGALWTPSYKGTHSIHETPARTPPPPPQDPTRSPQQDPTHIPGPHLFPPGPHLLLMLWDEGFHLRLLGTQSHSDRQVRLSGFVQRRHCEARTMTSWQL